MSKKGQAAMEFLMTYGWAILVVLAAIGALAYFGFFNQSNYVQRRCELPPGFYCKEKVTPTEISLMIQNGGKGDLTNVDITVQDNNGNDFCSNPVRDQTLNDGSSITVKLTGCANGAAGQKFRGNIIINYQEVGGFSHTERGTLISRVE